MDRFYAELDFNLEKREIEGINAFDTVDYLEKYRGIMADVQSKIGGLRIEQNPFNNL